MQAAVEKLQETMANLDHQWRRHLRLRRTRPKRREIRQVGWRGQRVHRPTRPELQAGAGAGNRLLRPTTTRRRAPARPSRPWVVTSCISDAFPELCAPPRKLPEPRGMNQLRGELPRSSGASCRSRSAPTRRQEAKRMMPPPLPDPDKMPPPPPGMPPKRAWQESLPLNGSRNGLAQVVP